MHKRVWAGVDIGGTKTAVVLSCGPPETLCREEFPTRPDQGPSPAIARIVELLRGMLAKHGVTGGELEAIGISCGGPLDSDAGVIQSPPNLASWVDVPITAILAKEFGTLVRLENDANAGAVAEHRYGAGRGTAHMIFLTMGTGLGAGMIVNGRLYRGATGGAGEIGHVRLTRTGPIGFNKAGSVEGWASGAGIAQIADRLVSRAAAQGCRTVLSVPPEPASPITARDVGLAAAQGDRVALRIIRVAGEKLGRGLAILIDVVNPERIVIGGLAMRLGELILAPARRAARQEALTASADACQIVPAELDESIGDVAALCVATGIGA